MSDNKNYDIVKNYTKELELFLGHVVVRSTHKDTNICFNSMYSDILSSIFDCLKNYDDKIGIIYKSSLLGKVLVIKADTLPINPPFKDIVNIFKKNFFLRLDKLEIDSDDDISEKLVIERKKLLNRPFVFDSEKKYRICHKMNLPSPIISNIISFVFFDYRPYYLLRSKYTELIY